MSSFWKNQEKPPRIPFLTKTAKNGHCWRYFLNFFRNHTFLRAGGFCVAFSSSRRFFWAIKTVFRQFLKFVIIRKFWGVKKLPNMGKKGQNYFFWKFFKSVGNRNKKMSGRSDVIPFGVFTLKNGTLYCTWSHYTVVHCTTLWYTVLHPTTLWYIVLDCKTLQSTKQCSAV